MAIEQTLQTLRDVQGVYGSFVIAGNGSLVARDLPAVFDAQLLAEVGPRVTRLFETFLSGGEELDACVLRYAEHKLYLRSMTWGTVGVLSALGVNMPALRMVVNLVIRKIDPEVQAVRQSSTPSAPAVDRPQPSLVPPSVRASSAPAVSLTPLPRATSSFPPVVSSPSVGSTPPTQRASTPPLEVTPDADAAATRPVRMYRGRPVIDD